MKVCITFDKRNTWVDRVFILLLALSPILQHYKGPFMNAGVTALIFVIPYMFIKLIINDSVSGSAITTILPLILFLVFKVVDHGTYLAEFGQVIILIVYTYAFASKAINSKLFIQTAVKISCIASVLIIIQYFFYYILNHHLQLVPTTLLLSNASQWIELAKTGRVGVTGRVIGFYRPSSIFLEPSHMFLYMFPPLLYELLRPKSDKGKMRKAVLISVGMLLSTSGMGIGVTCAAWLLFLATKGEEDTRFSLVKLMQPRNVLLLAALAILLVILFYNVDFFHKSVLRLFTSESGNSNAISGRVRLGRNYVRRLRGKNLILGLSDKYSDVEFNMSGFYGTMYKYGIVGTALSYLFYFKSLFNQKNQYFWIAVVLIAASFFTAHTHGTFYMLYFVIFLIDGYCNENNSCDALEESLPSIPNLN